MKKIIAFAIIISGVIFAIIKAEEPEKEEYAHLDPSMPRQKSFVGMEIGDVEYLELEKEILENRKNQKEEVKDGD